MSDWKKFDFEGKLQAILQSSEFRTKKAHHFDHPYVSAYQLAVAFERQYPELCQKLDKVIEGAGRGIEGKDSLTRYIAQQLSAHIKAASDKNEFYPFEAAWLSAEGLGKLRFIHDSEEKSGGPNTEYGGFSLYRLRED